ncbi:Ubiquitin-protein ligase E3A, partial [Lachnellula suecica]
PVPATEDEVYAALWATARFPRLPLDAPEQLKKVTIDIDDPKRVYTVHQAARRHHFQILVERYIFQIRYGCTSKACATSTCFSSRKRVAAGAPVRRYNATSARTLAVYMASQDNPEQGLCHNPSADRPIPQNQTPLKPRMKDVESASNMESVKRIVPKRSKSSSQKPHPLGSNKTKKEATSDSPDKVEADQDVPSPLEELDEPTQTDHRSFVQNVFGTTAFKMLEWLTPRNLERLSRPEEVPELVEKKTPENTPKDCSKPQLGDRKESLGGDATWKAAKITHEPGPPKAERASPKLKTSLTNGTNKSSTGDSTTAIPKRTPSSRWRKKSDTIENEPPKGILNIPSRIPDTAVDMTLPQFRPSHHKQRMSRQPSITSPQIQVAEITSMTAGKATSVKIITEPKRMAPKSEDLRNTRSEAISTSKPVVEKPPQKTEAPEPRKLKTLDPPQSMSHLPIDLINFLCDAIQVDGTSEKHDLKPSRVGKRIARWQHHPNEYLSGRDPRSREVSVTLREQWHAFVQQSFFDVLSKPESLLKTFRDDEGQPLDTNTIWYLLLRMIRVAPSLVFHSLWNVAGALFEPPDNLQVVYDWSQGRWSKDPRKYPLSKSLSNQEAAEVINICLHALVATAPLVSNARQLANMSRIRSYGLTMLGREKTSLEPAALCLQYEDAFTNDLALRLARRLFASIPTRRRFPNVLEAVLAKLNFLEIIPMLKFNHAERDLHDKRVPTLFLDWARTVLLQDWQGSAEVSAEGTFGGALALIAAIYEHRKSLLLGDIHFRTEYFAERLDSVEMPIEWLQFEPNKHIVHLLDFPYLFNPSTLVTYFRSINYSRMNQAFEVARANMALIRSIDPEMKLMPDAGSRHRLYDRIQVGTASFMVLEISRKNVLEDTFNAIWRREEREIMRPLKIRLGEDGGEEGMDSGGVQQEFFRLAIAEALNPDYGTFTIDSRTKMTWFQPGSPEPLWKFELIGLIISLAVYNGLTLPVTFPKALYQKLLDEDVTELHHIADGWPDLANGLTTLLEWDEKDGLVEDIFARTYEFSVDQLGHPVSVEMTPSPCPWPQFSNPPRQIPAEEAPMVTNANRNAYVTDYIRFLTSHSIAPQFSAFRKGFLTCLHPRSLSLFNASTLQSVVEGVQDIDISELRRCTRYIGWDASHHTIRDFWSVVRRYDLEQKKRLLEFVTASDRVPVGGMRGLQFTIQRNGVDDGHLPSSYTCYGILLLPEYSTREVLRGKLGVALENSRGFGFA